MILFLFRKFFYDLWDNLFTALLINIGFILITAAAFTLPPLFALLPAPLPFLGTALFFALLYAAAVWHCAAALALKDASDYRGVGIADFFAAFKKGAVWTAAIVSAAALAFIFFLVRFAAPFYLFRGDSLGLALAAFCLWTSLALCAALQFFPAVRFRLGPKLFKSIKKCFLFFIDNPLFCVLCFFFNIIFSIFIITCPSLSILFLDEALRLRLFKYDWLEAQGEGASRRVPWKELLADEIEKTGRRGWKDFVFPWRD